MPIADDETMDRITRSWAGLHFTLAQAERIKKWVDMLTDRREFCPCSECLEKKLPIRAGHN